MYWSDPDPQNWTICLADEDSLILNGMRVADFVRICYPNYFSICIKYCSNKIKVGDELSYKSFLLEVFL